MEPTAPLSLRRAILPSPLGEMVLVFDDEHVLRALDWADHDERTQRLLRLHYGIEGKGYRLTPAPCPTPLACAFEGYFGGQLEALDALPVATNGTPFQRDVWTALRTLPAGSTTPYGALAAKLGKPAAVRAVGLANGANPIGIVVPCHRVIGANGTLTGYGGGLERKAWLLAHEGVALPRPRIPGRQHVLPGFE